MPNGCSINFERTLAIFEADLRAAQAGPNRVAGAPC
jgi:hypothetical protein